MENQKYSIAIIGSTSRTTRCAQALLESTNFKISWIVTPQPKQVGRKKILTINPLHQFAQDNQIKNILIQNKIDQQIQNQIQNLEKPDLILVVDFGYIIPDWLLKWPTVAPLNIHPSKLPAWRGSSPGQFVLLFGDKNSAVTLMKINNKLDQGDIITQLPFQINQNWTQVEYYQHSFDLIIPKLPLLIENFLENPDQITEQPLHSPTPIAKRIKKEDAFIEWDIVKQAMQAQRLSKAVSSYDPIKISTQSSLLDQAFQHHLSWPLTIHAASKAFQPWPQLWTIIPTAKGKKRMKILQTSIENQKLNLVQVQIEGQSPAFFNQVKNNII